MPRKRKIVDRVAPKFVDFSYEDRTYQIDPDHNKVYRRFVEIETSKACLILSNWRASFAA